MTIKRSRSRYRSGGKGSSRQLNGQAPLNKNHVFDSRGPDVRLRGTAQQLFEKYLQLAQDAVGGDDKVMVDAYFQYAEHYFRTLNAMTQATKRNYTEQGEQPHQQQPHQHSQRIPPFLHKGKGGNLSHLEPCIVENDRRASNYFLSPGNNIGNNAANHSEMGSRVNPEIGSEIDPEMGTRMRPDVSHMSGYTDRVERESGPLSMSESRYMSHTMHSDRSDFSE
ncbi:MAG: DUF4167 domain-containing protein [Acetobacter sp.]|nr:DUF4167 domain-containing protein [Acetobacter sp.]